MNEDDFLKRMYESRIKGGSSIRESPPGHWINRVSDYWRETGRARNGMCWKGVTG